MQYFAHSRNDAGQRQLLSEHLFQVSQQAALSSASFEASELARLVGLLHDIGKFHPAFQQYLLLSEQNPSMRRHGPDHKGAGSALLATLGLADLAFLVQGHHGGLRSRSVLKPWLLERQGDPAVQEAITIAQKAWPGLQKLSAPPFPAFVRTPFDAELFVRFLFSALVDADFLDTEAHFQGYRTPLRHLQTPLAPFLSAFEAYYQQQFAHVAPTPVNEVRRQVYHACVQMSPCKPGLYRLTVPTGGGKTLASLAFGLHHAQQHAKKRLIYAIPYMSITEQTAGIFRRIFPDGGVLEHHSGIVFQENAQGLSSKDLWRRLATENWDAPIVVTTTVQFFESLLARSTGSCRKLHNIAESVVVLDEVQLLPTNVLDTILDVLQQLVAHYKVTVVLCTATQPAFHQRNGFEGLSSLQEIIPDAQVHFATLQRVQYTSMPDPQSWEEVAEQLQKEHQALSIVNTRAHALELVDALSGKLPDTSSLFHLSTRMCGAHRRFILRCVQQRLAAGEACHLVSTQLIEAGVDIDFPCVWRAIGPLDRIVQAAGRANREGKYPIGRVVIFEPVNGSLPPGPYKIGTQITRMLLKQGVDLHNPNIFPRYFADLFEKVERDERHIQAARKAWDYETVAEQFRLITDKTTSVVVSYQENGEDGTVAKLLEELQVFPLQAGALLRRLQPYMVNLRDKELADAQKKSLVQEVFPGLWQWLGTYDETRGIMLDSFPDPDYFVW